MDRALWESLFDCPIDLRRFHDAGGVTYTKLWGSDDAAEPPTSAQLGAKSGPPRFVVRGRHQTSQS
jgi:hypothetical protein